MHIIGIDPDDPQGLKDYLGDRDVASLQGIGTVDHQVFFEDPSGVTIELNYPAAETAH